MYIILATDYASGYIEGKALNLKSAKVVSVLYQKRSS